MTTTEVFLLAMLIIFSVPYLIWRLAKTDYWAPLVVVQIMTGILLGPGVFGHFFPENYEFVFFLLDDLLFPTLEIHHLKQQYF